ncbi:MAG: hypothetical protein GXZ13_07165 [Synergistaceae bacterium]|nr:hypothetical protein [Synergistaceae bacterium]NLY87984.1 hypothetical protein [Clostridiales bacterium]
MKQNNINNTNKKNEDDNQAETETAKKESNGDKIIKWISLFLSIVAMVQSCMAYNIGKNNETLVLDSNIKFEILDDVENKEKYVSMRFNIKQGNLNKLYLAKPLQEDRQELQYELLDHSNLTTSFLLEKNKTDTIISDSQNNSSKIDSKIDSYKLQDFFVIVQDYTKEWHIYYLLIRPEIHLDNYEYHFKVESNDEVVAEYKKEAEPMEFDYTLIDCTLINNHTLESKIKDFEEKNSKYFLFEDEQELKGKNGEQFKSHPFIQLNYHFPSAKEILKKLEVVKNDIDF